MRKFLFKVDNILDSLKFWHSKYYILITSTLSHQLSIEGVSRSQEKSSIPKEIFNHYSRFTLIKGEDGCLFSRKHLYSRDKVVMYGSTSRCLRPTDTYELLVIIMSKLSF